ncbi:MAG: imidazolonepropionase [Planctomycetota bacterium]|nr:imidazolonepropionase [Planctomycetota bacterium]MDA1105467.1 imidazolonepropionase [Planctomycetota bacterium]
MTYALSNARIVTMRPMDLGVRRGTQLCDLGTIPRGFVAIDHGTITECTAGDPPAGMRSIDLQGRTILPGWVDCHTHACWAGDRSNEWARKLSGVPYLEILASGGGIMSTVRSVRAATAEHLTALLVRRLHRMLALGTVACEVKTGYGLSVDAESKMLRSILSAGTSMPGMPVIPTYLGAHALDPEHPDWVRECIDRALPAAARAVPGISCDLFCEKGAWSVDDSLRLLERAAGLGCPLRVHTDQFTSTGLVPHAVRMRAKSIDHLEASTDDDLRCVAESGTIGVGLPASPFALSTPYMRGRAFIDMGGAIAIASNWNPGSAPTPSVAFAAALAVRHMGLTPEEAITAATWNAAHLLGLESDTGALHVGKAARLQVVDAPDERACVLELAGGAPALVVSPMGVSGCDAALVAAATSADPR